MKPFQYKSEAYHVAPLPPTIRQTQLIRKTQPSNIQRRNRLEYTAFVIISIDIPRIPLKSKSQSSRSSERPWMRIQQTQAVVRFPRSLLSQDPQPLAQQPPRPAQSWRRNLHKYQPGLFLPVLKAQSSVPTVISSSSSQRLCASALKLSYKFLRFVPYTKSRYLVAILSSDSKANNVFSKTLISS